MLAKLKEKNGNFSYYHVGNKGSDNRDIFKNKEDFDTFLSYLNEYLNPPIDPSTVKKEFVVNGKKYKGSPRLPKNYYQKIELLAFDFNNKSFSLLLKQNEKDLISAFIRSLCTRYSIYYNKKYHHTGQVFDGPYKTHPIKNDKQLSLLINHLNKGDNALAYTDYELLNEVLFVQKPEYINTLSKNDKSDIKYFEIYQRAPELFTLGLVFLILVAIGVRNINLAQTSKVAGVSIQEFEYKTLDINSQNIGLAKYGENFEYVSLDSNGSIVTTINQ